MYKRMVANRIIMCIISFAVYFIADYFIIVTKFLHHFPTYVGLKSFLPVTLGLLLGPYGIIGELCGCILASMLLKISYDYVIAECICILIPGFGSWFLWHLKTRTNKIHFRYIFDYTKYIIIIVLTFLISGFLCYPFFYFSAIRPIMIWGISLSLFVGIPIIIIYSGLMCLNPILPPYKGPDGKRISIKDDLVVNLSEDVNTYAELTEQIEEFAMKKKIDFKRLFELQNCIEEVYLRIIHNVPGVYIDFRLSYDITFSIEFNYIGKKYNPLYVTKLDAVEDIAGLKLIQHRALLAVYSYLYGENNIHIVV